METASRRRWRGAVCMKSTCAEARKRQRRPHTLSGTAGLSGRGRRTCRPCLALPPSSGFWPKACGKPRQHISPPSFVIVKNSIPQSLASLLYLSTLLSVRERLLCLRHPHCRHPSGPPELRRLGLPKQPNFTNCLWCLLFWQE
jgi:hypothetical protein